MDTLRFITCGSVDDGKSTLIGRLLYETKKVFEDQLHSLAGDSKTFGTQGQKLDFALLVDGLQAEREQGITIDVAYRYFSTDHRRFIVADTPGHEQYTRNMATAASMADVAILLVDAQKGLQPQTLRHSRIARLMGIRSVALAINKMDLVDWSAEHFEAIASAYRLFAASIGIEQVQAIPVSALDGDNIVRSGSECAPWYKGVSIMEWLEAVPPRRANRHDGFVMPVQWVSRPDANFRGFAGRISSGNIKPGDRVRISPSGHESVIARIVGGDRDMAEASMGQSVTLVLTDAIDISRGDVIAATNDPVAQSTQFEAQLIWMNAHQLLPGRSYYIQIHRKFAAVQITNIKHRIDIQSGVNLAAKTLEMNDIGVVTLALDRAVPFAPYEQDETLGAFILIDRLTNETLGAGMILHALRRAENIHTQALTVTKDARAAIKVQRPRCLWLTGLSGSGKSTIANLLEQRLAAEGKHTYLLDGDNVRHGLNKDLGFTEADRVENIRRVAEVAKLMVDAGLIVLVSFISPFEDDRALARSLFAEGEFLEIFIDAPLAICEERDVKGLYAKARRGEIKNFTGIDSAYEAPVNPEICVRTDRVTPDEAVQTILNHL